VFRLADPVNAEAFEAPGLLGARREHTGSMRPTSNNAGQDASMAERSRILETGL
jgi:hypothetical protein